MNDVASLKKEVVRVNTHPIRMRHPNVGQAENQVDSVIPLKMHLGNHTNAQAALDDVITDLIRSRHAFNSAEDCLLSSVEYRQANPVVQHGIQLMIQSCKNIMLGNVKWS